MLKQVPAHVICQLLMCVCVLSRRECCVILKSSLVMIRYIRVFVRVCVCVCVCVSQAFIHAVFPLTGLFCDLAYISVFRVCECLSEQLQVACGLCGRCWCVCYSVGVCEVCGVCVCVGTVENT